MSEQTTARRIAHTEIALMLLALASKIFLELIGQGFGGDNAQDLYFVPITVLGTGLYAWIGRLIVVRQPRNTIGWLLITIPLVAALALANGAYATHALVTDPGSLPFGVFSAWVDRWAIVATSAMLIPIFLLYPDGQLPSPRWRWVLAVTIAAPTLAIVAFALTPGRLTGAYADLEHVRVLNPLGIAGHKELIDRLTIIFGVVTFGTAVLAGAAIVVRYRRAGIEVRQQIRWLALVAGGFFACIVAAMVVGDNDPVGNVIFILMFILLVVGVPVACGIAILKYRLYELDVVVRKTVVFGLLALFIAVVYVAVVGGIGLFVGSTSNPFLSFAAAAVLAVAFQPARDRARRFADRIVYGKRATPYEVLAEFSGRMSETYATEDILPRMVEILRAGTGARAARVWLRVGGELRPEAATGTATPTGPVVVSGDAFPEMPGGHAVEVRHQGELLGALSVEMSPSDPMTPAKDKLVRDLAAQAGLVLRNVKLIEDLRASRQRLVTAQDEERRKIERNLHDGAQQQLVALTVQLKLAEQLAGREPDKERELLRRLQGQATAALEDLRDLARGIYPPLLADQGLAAAIGAQGRKSSVPVSVEPDGVGRYPQEIEAAVYFCVLEALQNVAKYADASHATVRLSSDGGGLSFEVTDDGRGFDPSSARPGTGLQGMADRLDAIGGSLEVRSARGSGTTILGKVPVREVG